MINDAFHLNSLVARESPAWAAPRWVWNSGTSVFCSKTLFSAEPEIAETSGPGVTTVPAPSSWFASLLSSSKSVQLSGSLLPHQPWGWSLMSSEEVKGNGTVLGSFSTGLERCLCGWKCFLSFEDTNSVPSTYIGLITICTSSSKGLDILVWPPWEPTYRWHTCKHT